MKDWKYIKVGNYDAQEKLGLKPVQGEIEKEVYSVYTQTGKDKEKTKKALKSKHPNLDDQWLDKLLSKLVGNESIDKQEWSMFKGLKKDAEKEIGNETYQHKLYPDKYVIIDGKNYKIITDGKVEKSGELTDAILYGINQTYKRVSSMNSKTGNKAIVLKDGNVWVVLYANETKSQEFESEAEAREFAKKVGNSLPHDYHNRYPSDPIYADMKSSATLEAIKKEPWRVYDIMGVGDSIARERVFEMIEEKYKIDYNDIYEAWMGHSWDKAVQKKSMEDAKRLAQKLGLRFGNKTGNESIGDEYNAEIYRLEKKKMDLERMGQGQKAREIEKQIQQLQKELREYDIGNKKTGNARLGKFLMAGGHTATLVEEGGKFIVKYDDGRTETFMTRKAAEDFLKVHSELYIGNEKISYPENKLESASWTTWKYIISNPDKYDEKTVEKARNLLKTKTGNETKAEEKFGKVMGEYKEGALKTPQGKTVTDPAQAKAIAYSEADKVDNLKRARNAMNKKK